MEIYFWSFLVALLLFLWPRKYTATFVYEHPVKESEYNVLVRRFYSLENLAKIHPRARLDVPVLVKRGLLYEDPAQPECYRLLSESLERWINREIAAGEESEETPASVEPRAVATS